MAIGDRPPVNIPASGAFNQPPPNAPRETTAGAVPQPTADQVRQARANERELAPLVFAVAQLPIPSTATSNVGGSAIILTDAAAPAAPAATSSVLPTPRPGPRSRLAAVAQRIVTAGTNMLQGAAEPQGTSDEHARPDHAGLPADVDRGDDAGLVAAAEPIIEPAAIAAAQPYQPAASNTDSPSRGLPTRSHDPGKQITGGFGDVGEAQYFPLDGAELRELVFTQLDKLRARLRDDLRFSIAVTYPRVACRVVIEVDAFVADASFQVPVVLPPHTKTPLAIAKDYGDQIVFVVTEEMREMTADGEWITPPNAVRQSLGLSVPHKHFVQAGARRIMVDVE